MMDKIKGLVVTGLSGGSGKSIVSVGLTAALSRSGAKVLPFKKGPDYIDAGWLQKASTEKCYNLDPYFVENELLKKLFATRAQGAEYIVVEGSRGLYDGVNVDGGYSTAELAITLGLPVVLVVNCTKTTRTIAALVLGCKLFDERVNIAGVILNQIATKRQKKLISKAVEKYTGIPVVGAIPRTKREVFPMRHLGMLPHQEYEGSDEAVEYLAELVSENVDLEKIENIMSTPSWVATIDQEMVQPIPQTLKIGVIRDAAFQFYYFENLEALEQGGAELIFLDAMSDEGLPELDGLYIGGGFPETGAARLAANKPFMESIRENVEKALPVYAECGGLIYLGSSIEVKKERYDLVSVFPTHFGMSKKPQAHGYSIFKVDQENPFYEVGTVIKGHEFRYSTVQEFDGTSEDLKLQMERGTGFMDGRDGLCYKNVLAMYTHVHADGAPLWVEGFLKKCADW